MGLFSRKAKIFVGTSAARTIPDDQIVSSVESGTTQFIINGGNIDEHIMEDAVKGLAIKAKNYFNFGRDHYVYGLPKSNIISPLSGALEVQEVLEDIEGATVTVSYSFTNTLNYAHIARQELLSTYGYDADTDELPDISDIKGATVTLTKIILRASTVNLTDLPPEAFLAYTGSIAVEVDEGISTIGLDIRYEWVASEYNPSIPGYEDVLHTEDITVTNDLTIPSYDVNADFFHVEYLVGGDTKYWTYKIGTGTYPSLDNIYEEEYTENGTYLPWTYFRYAATSMDVDPESTEYLSSKKLFHKLGADYAETVAAVNENPDIGDVQQALLYAAVPALSTNQVDSEYLFKFFSVAYANEGGQLTALSRAAFEAALNYSMLNPFINRIQDARMRMLIGHSGIWKRIVTGVIGPVGFYKNEAEWIEYTEEYVNREGVISTNTRDVSSHYYMKQINETQYEEIQVLNLRLQYHVYDGYMSVGDIDTETDTLLIPLDMSIVSTFGFLKREELYARSFHYIFNSMEMVKVKWYQTGFFKVFMLVAAIAITIYSLGTGIKVIGAAMAAGTLTIAKLVWIIATEVFWIALKQVSVKLFVKAVGIETAFVVAIIAALNGVRVGFEASNLQGFVANAKLMLSVSCNLIQSTVKEIQDILKDINLELAEFNTYAEQQFKLLEDVEKSLEKNPAMQPMLLLGEKPDAFYSRTIHSENVGMIPIHMVRQYVDDLLRLPNIQDTLGV